MTAGRPMRTHELKTWPEPFTALARGEKAFEYRFDDRGYAVGDELILREWDPTHSSYTGRMLHVYVVYMLAAGFGLPPGFVIMSVRKAAPVAPPEVELQGERMPVMAMGIISGCGLAMVYLLGQMALGICHDLAPILAHGIAR